MASINEKLNYINETKSLIKDKLNDLGSEIDNETTFREYAEKIENLYEEWPKINDEDTTINLENTKKGKMILQLKGNTYQNGIPSPSSPISIDNVSGNNEINIIGKNWLKNTQTTQTINGVTFTINNDKTITVNGTATALITFNLINSSFILPSGQYFISGCPNGGSDSSYRLDMNNGAVVNQRDYGNGNSFILSNDTTIDNVRIRIASGVTINNLIFKPMIENGSAATAFEPYQSQNSLINLGDMELCKIGTYQDYIYKDSGKWYLHKEVDKVVLNGSETWNIINSGTSNWYYQVAGTRKATEQLLQLCTHYPNEGIYNGNTTQGIMMTTSGIDIRIRYGTEDTIANYKSWLSFNNVSLYYSLTTPIEEEITNTTLINQLEDLRNTMSYEKQTNISQINNNLPFIINASVLLKNSN